MKILKWSVIAIAAYIVINLVISATSGGPYLPGWTSFRGILRNKAS